MRHLILISAMLCMFSFVKAGEKAPAPFQDSDIKRKLKDGKVQKFDGNKYMIVRRGVKKEPVVKTVVKEKPVYKKNRISLLVGSAPNGDLDTELRQGQIRVSTENELTFGLQYQRMFTERINLGIQIQTNESVFGSVGLDF